jgi:hypothetical protein
MRMCLEDAIRNETLKPREGLMSTKSNLSARFRRLQEGEDGMTGPGGSQSLLAQSSSTSAVDDAAEKKKSGATRSLVANLSPKPKPTKTRPQVAVVVRKNLKLPERRPPPPRTKATHQTVIVPHKKGTDGPQERPELVSKTKANCSQKRCHVFFPGPGGLFDLG